jgi:XTP/dITP diphosphohydrolase
LPKILFATGNEHKLAEAREILPELELLSLADFPNLQGLDPSETGTTFEENATIKAKAYGKRAKLPTLAEDAGLMVDALGNEPGVYSARWVAGSDRDRYQTLLKRLGANTNRAARFVAVICLYDPKSSKTECFRGEALGKIALEAKGNNGFGYDPVFVPEGHSKTFGELDTAIKHQLSHRKKALSAFYEWWLNRPRSS